MNEWTSPQLWHTILEGLDEAVNVFRAQRDPSTGDVVDFEIVFQNSAGRNVIGAATVGMTYLTKARDHQDDGFELLARVLEDGHGLRQISREIDGAMHNFDWQGVRLDSDTVLGMLHETTESVQRLRRGTAIFRAAFEASVAGMAIVEADSTISRANARLGEILGYEAKELTGCNLREFSVPSTGDALVAAFDAAIRRGGESVSIETLLVSSALTNVWVEATFAAVEVDEGESSRAVLHVLDVSDRKSQELQLAYAATHDALTGLPNRALVLDHLQLGLTRSQSGRNRLMVLFLDLDHFKVVNDSLGHSSGDGLLREVAARLAEATAPGDTVSRLGGDEFVMICDIGLTDPEEAAAATCQQLLDALRAPVEVEGHEVVIQASIGVKIADPAATPESLLRDADVAMYEAKKAGRATWALFTSELHDLAVDRLEVEAELRAALATTAIRSFFQPVVDLFTGRTVGFEALARWNRNGTFIGPSAFLEMAEETGLVIPLTERVAWDAACGLARWQAGREASLGNLWLAFNVSARHLTTPGFASWVDRLVTEAGLPMSAIVLELTERTMLQSNSLTNRTLFELRSAGCRIAIDDFGTGYSSLAYLRNLPVDILKIDRTFIEGAPYDRRDRALLGAFVQLAEALDLVVIAEGIETPEQAEVVRAAGCRLAQGYQLARPSPELGVA